MIGERAADGGAAASAPALAQSSVSITSSPANGTHYVAGEAITTRITIPQLGSGNVSNARMKLDVGGVERHADPCHRRGRGFRRNPAIVRCRAR